MRTGQLGVFPVLQGPDVPIRQFSKRIDQALYAAFENAMAARSLHEILRRRNSSLLYYSVDPIEPGLLDELARERGIHGFLRGDYAYVAGSGRAVVTLELHDQSCKQVARVRRVLGDRRLADWMNTVLDKDLTADESAAYSFPEPDVTIDLVQDELVRVAGSVLTEAARKLGGRPDAESRPFFLRPAILPGNEQEEETFKRLYQQLDDSAARAIEAGARQGLDPAKSLDTVPVEIGGEQFANYRRAYGRIVEQIGTAFECSNAQLFRVQVTKYLFDQLIERPPVEGLDLVAPPGIAEGEFTVDDTTVLVQPVVRIDGGKLTCLVRVIDANRPNRVLVQRSTALPRQLTKRLQPQLEARARDHTAPQLTPSLQKLLAG